MKKKILLIILCLALISSLLVGCNRMKQAGAESDFSGATISNNGGIAVKYGNYVYFINGLAAQDADNTFGEVTKGAIARLELDANGKIKDDSTEIIVPKVAFGKDTASGLTIQGDYIYFSTTSTRKDSQGLPKVNAMVLMRSTLDGSLTEQIKEFDNFDSKYRVVDGYIIYDIVNDDGDKEIRSINLSNKKFEETLIASKVTSILYVNNVDGVNPLANYVFYTKAHENENTYHNEVYVASADNKVNKIIIDKDSYDTLLHSEGYRITLADYNFIGQDKIRLIYNKVDKGVNVVSSGTYSYDFNLSFDFEQSKEVRYSNGQTYSKLRFLTENYVLATKSSSVELLTITNGVIKREEILSFVPTILKTEVIEGKLYATYTRNNFYYRIKMFDIVDGEYKIELDNAVLLYDKDTNKTWAQPEIIGDYLYFFNTQITNNAYALDLTAVKERDEDSRRPKLIGIMTPADEIAAIG